MKFLCLFFAEVAMLINYWYEVKGKDVFKLVIGIYVVINIILGMFAYNSVLDLLSFCSIILTKMRLILDN